MRDVSIDLDVDVGDGLVVVAGAVQVDDSGVLEVDWRVVVIEERWHLGGKENGILNEQ